VVSATFDWPEPYPADRVGRPSRKAATTAIEVHLEVLKGEPLRRTLSEHLKGAGNLGGQERRFVAFASRELSRHMRLLDHASRLLGQAPGKLVLREDQALVRYALWRRLFCGLAWKQLAPEVRLPGPVRPRSLKDDQLERLVSAPLPPPPAEDSPEAAAAVRHSLPGWLATRLAAEAPPGEAAEVFAALNREPAIQLRARPPLDAAAAAAALAEESVASHAVEGVPGALVVDALGMRVFESRPMRARQLQVQDVGSQLIVALCGTPEELSGRTAADVCAGAAGKTIGLADRVGPRGKVLAGDLSKRRLAEGRERVRELGLRQVSFPVPLTLASAGVVLVDAPCSGTGSLAREPDAKWTLRPERVAELGATQRKLLAETAASLAPGAVLVYATCSLLKEENEAVVEDFLSRHPGFRVEPAGGWVDARFCAGPYLRVWPHRSEGGGFFAARLRRADVPA
jgi:16S rRNA (cytosine967-C5)-methyltransferase